MSDPELRQGFGFPDVSKITGELREELRSSFDQLIERLEAIHDEIKGLRADIRGDDVGGVP